MAEVSEAPFFREIEDKRAVEPNNEWDDKLWWFGAHSQALTSSPPDWFSNPFSDETQPDSSLDWWSIPDFNTGDIKGLWELSRMDWVVAWATTSACGDMLALERLNRWLSDWAHSNPPYKGPNWKCGQEASIRVMHLVAAAWVLGQDLVPEKGLIDLLCSHLQRIAPTTDYALGQQNNHGTSEAAALFVGGSFLQGYDPRAEVWELKGRRLLEERAITLIEPDGSFSQYSTNYHRLMLDSYSLAEAWRRRRGLPPFSKAMLSRLSVATEWLWAMVDINTGDVPNIGGNDGARILQLTGSDYRDFRPSVQLAAALFCGLDAFGEGQWASQLSWLSVQKGDQCLQPKSRTFHEGGYHVLRRESIIAVLHYPRFHFRPSQSDALHLDLWCDGVNLLRDAGTYSYNSRGAAWFSGTSAHNTIEFDERDQMPRLGRFLFGSWPDTTDSTEVTCDGDALKAAAGYVDFCGAYHHRSILLCPEGLTCSDTISGHFKIALLRWRLAPGDWLIENGTVKNGDVQISLEFEGDRICPTLGHTVESRYYQQKVKIPEVWIQVDRPGKIVTRLSF